MNDKCYWCGEEYSPVADLFNDQVVCSDCGKEQPEEVLAGQIREYKKPVNVGGMILKEAGEMLYIDKVEKLECWIDGGRGVIKAVPLKWIIENTKIQR